ncbi:serine/threonine-protein kinase [Roseisolibacter sp. H3M3-2]|uniref:serine/threonine-protein kinase n=1 Tax=Roseisolibacter sp. H3M3-2 TaxID=3031323 RepID=UPI0023D9FA7C|nr:serine/threonine-protein kinase [Roseisolibacter sp. H3M3-2]MDF1502835.1 serine/threonine-protein kinase [Roseisolibacter sp. H3M3-2]
MPEPVVTTSENELRTVVERALASAYELDREIGRGGMGIVYRARDRRLKRHVAIKLLPPELAYRSEIRSRFLREAETAAQLSHPHIVPIYSVDEVDGLVYFVMACVDGDNLGKRIHDRGPLPVSDVRRILAEVADALAYAHARGVVHRDIKPDNILLDTDEDRALVTDFGIARAIIEGSDARLTATGMAIGTPAFMSPEQSAGDREIDGRSDLYSLGVVAYQMLAGELPFQATSTPAMLVKHLSERPVPVNQRRPDCPPDLNTIVMRLLEKEPAQRFSGAAELEAVLRGSAPIAPASFATTQPPQQARHAPLPPGPNTPTRGPAPYAPAPTAPASFGGFGDYGDARPYGSLPAPLGQTGDVDAFTTTAEEERRWDDPRVVEFRRKLGWFAIIGSVLFVVGVFGDADFFGALGLWAVYIAFKYAKLWSNGFDWHDVLREPRERLFADVAAEGVENVQAFFDRDKRARLRERERRRRNTASYRALPPGGGPAAGYGDPALPAPRPVADLGAQAEVVRQAAADRDEILRLLATMPKPERARIPEVEPSARALAEKVEALAGIVADLDRSGVGGDVGQVEAEITRLEAEANPLDRERSETRVKRLAVLKRQRRALTDVGRRREAAASKLENCRLALQNMRIDLVRLRTGSGSSPLQVTSVAERAMALAREVDGLVGAADDVLGAGGAGAREPQPGRG